MIPTNLDVCSFCNHKLNYISVETGVCFFCGMRIEKCSCQVDSKVGNVGNYAIRKDEFDTRKKKYVSLDDFGFDVGKYTPRAVSIPIPNNVLTQDIDDNTCTECGGRMAWRDGCHSCLSCGHSDKCSA